MFERSWPIDDVVTFTEETDWMTGASMDGVDYNITGLRILPMSHEWDFEGGVQGWSLSSGGGWAHGYDSTLGATNGVHSGHLQSTHTTAIIPIKFGNDILGNITIS